MLFVAMLRRRPFVADTAAKDAPNGAPEPQARPTVLCSSSIEDTSDGSDRPVSEGGASSAGGSAVASEAGDERELSGAQGGVRMASCSRRAASMPTCVCLEYRRLLVHP